jgi:hypothetical protein
VIWISIFFSITIILLSQMAALSRLRMAAAKLNSLFYVAPNSIQFSIEKSPFDDAFADWPMMDARRYVAVS